MYYIEVIGKVKGKARPRFARKGYVYTPKSTKEYEKTIQLEYLKKYHPLMSKKPIKLELLIYSKRLITTPDIDNVAKIVMDAFNGLVYEDDSQVVELNITRVMRKEEKLYIKWSEIEDDGI